MKKLILFLAITELTSAATYRFTTVTGGVTSFNTTTLDADVIVDGVTNKAFTAAERTKLAGISGTNTGDQDLSSYALTSALTSGLAGKSDTSHAHTFASLTSKPTTLLGYGITDAATFAQGAKADTALQPNGNGSSLTGLTKSQVGLSNVENTALSTWPGSANLTTGSGGLFGTLAYQSNTLSGTNTGDETLATIKSKLGITTLSGSNTGDQDLSSYITSATVASSYQPLDAQLTSLAGLAYASNSLKVLRVNSGETGFELATISVGGGDALYANNLNGFADVSQASGAVLTIPASATISGTNTGDQTTITGNAGTVTDIGNLTGVVTSTNRATSIANGAISNAMLANGAVANLSGTNTGDNAVNSLYSGLVSNATHTGDVTGATALTLATVNSNVGTFGSATHYNTFTVNGKGLITAASETAWPTFNQNTTGSAATVTDIGNLTGVVTSTNRATAIADSALSIAKTSGLQTALDGKQDTLVSGSNIKTVNGTSLVGAGNVALPAEIGFAASDESTALTTGTAKLTFRMPYAMTLTSVRASVNTAATGSTLIVDINEDGSTLLSTKLSIDVSEKTSLTATSAAVISDTALANDAEITIDIDQIGSTIAGKGLKIWLIGTR